jgi:hypothetical protein
MDSKHRHELQTNDLSKLAERIVKPLDAHANQVLGVVCVVSIIAAGVIYWVRSTNAKQSAAWTEIAAHRSADDLKDVAENYEGTSAALWAKLQEGERRLSEGIPLMFSDRETAVKELGKAKAAFESLLSRQGAPVIVRERALFGLARCLESQSDGGKSLDDAISRYEAFAKEFPDSPQKELAQKRVTMLKNRDAQEFYAWFSKENPKPPPPSKPADGKLPSFDDELPELPKGLRPRTPPETETPASDKPAESTEEKPAAKEGSPAETKPASDEKEVKPADDSKPKDEARSSDDKPADAKPDKSNP